MAIIVDQDHWVVDFLRWLRSFGVDGSDGTDVPRVSGALNRPMARARELPEHLAINACRAISLADYGQK